jgi:hypothetical protein
MERKIVAPYGTWESPFTAELVANAGGVARDPFDSLRVDGTTVYWLEPRPFEKGRSALVRWTPGNTPSDVTPAPANVGTRVHEYGGGAYAVANGTIVYSERSDDSVWLIDGAAPARCIARVPGCRFADFAFDPSGSRIYCVREDHRERPATEPANALVALDASGTVDEAHNEGSVLATGADFYAAPRPSTRGERLAWIEWDHPNMPWQETRLMLAPFDAAGALGAAAQLAGGPQDAVVQVDWSADGTLFFSSDRRGWWNVYARRDDGTIEALCPREQEIGGPPWIFGLRWFAPLDAGRVLCAVASGGNWHAATISGGELHPLAFGTVAGSPLPFGDGAVAIVRFADRPCEIRRLERLDGEHSETLARVAPLGLSPADVSLGRAEEIATGNGEIAHAFYYPPQNARFEGPPGELPPLVVTSHERLQPLDSMVDEPRFRRRRRQLSRLERIRFGLSPPARRRVDRTRRRGLHRHRARARRARLGRSETDGGPRRKCERRDGAGRADPRRHVRDGREPFRRRRPHDARARNAQVRIALYGHADRSLTGSARAVREPLTAHERRRYPRAGHPLSGRRR